MSADGPKDVPELLSAREVASLAGVSPSMLHEWAVRREAGLPAGGPPHVRLSAHRRKWMRADVIQWLHASRVE